MLAHFALRMIGGMSLMWALLPQGRIASGFFRIQMLVALALSVLAGLSIEPFPQVVTGEPLVSASAGALLCAVLAGLSFLGSVLWTLERRRGAAVCVLLVCGLSLVVLLGHALTVAALRTGLGWLVLFSELSSAALLGGAVVGMLLGHWYLTAPTMSLTPLHRINQYFAAAAVARLVLSSVGLWLGASLITGTTPAAWLALRWLAGIVGPLAVTLMVWRILKYRNTQSATGVLFVGVILTFLGETTALLLYRELLTPF